MLREKKKSNRIFVFGSNLAGIHGKGAALFAKHQHGAITGRGVGLQGNSYAIPTKDYRLQVLPVNVIKKFIDNFLVFAKTNPHLEFDLTPLGCGLAGYRREDIKPLFKDKPDNVHFTKEWEENSNTRKPRGR